VTLSKAFASLMQDIFKAFGRFLRIRKSQLGLTH
jgi:hypothetical protein